MPHSTFTKLLTDHSKERLYLLLASVWFTNQSNTLQSTVKICYRQSILSPLSGVPPYYAWGGGGDVALDLLFLFAAGSAYWPIAIRCPSLPLSEYPPSRCFGPPRLFLHVGGSRRPKHSGSIRHYPSPPRGHIHAHGGAPPSRVWVSCVNVADLSPLPPMCHTFTARQERQRSARSKSRDHPQHHQHMLNCPLHAMPPAMQYYGVVAGTALTLHQIFVSGSAT